LEGKDGILWICSEIGLSRYNRDLEDFTNFFPDTIDHYSPINSIREIYEVGENLMLNAGGLLFRFDTKTHEFLNLGITLPPEATEFEQPFTMITDSSGLLWALSNDNENLALIKYIPQYDKIQEFICSNDKQLKVSNLRITKFYKANSNTFWLATFGNGLYKLKVNKNGFFEYEHFTEDQPNSIISNYILAIFEDSKSNVWIGGKRGFFKLSDDGNDLSASDDPDNWVLMEGYGTQKITEDKIGGFWLNSHGGIFYYKPQNHGFTYFKHDHSVETSLAGPHSRQILIDNSGQPLVMICLIQTRGRLRGQIPI
jgi:ligand-binding sensor domain-containing protein